MLFLVNFNKAFSCMVPLISKLCEQMNPIVKVMLLLKLSVLMTLNTSFSTVCVSADPTHPESKTFGFVPQCRCLAGLVSKVSIPTVL